jgi:benzoyl-CoA-dihydrodiol lyase
VGYACAGWRPRRRRGHSTSSGSLRPIATGDCRSKAPSPRCDGRPGGRRPLADYRLKLNSYDLGVDIELADAVQRIRFEHPKSAVVITSLQGARLLRRGEHLHAARSTHAWKVNFCKFTNETRLAIEDASAHSGIKFLAALNGICAGGGYELALACDEILLVDDGNSAVSLPRRRCSACCPAPAG